MSSATILIIEDDPTMLRALKDNFEFCGYVVRTAVDGKAGLQAIHDTSPDLILLDLMLPKLNGYDICHRIRAAGSQVPIIMLTAKSQAQDVVRGLNLGADDYVTKPFSIDILLARVKARLRGRQDHDPVIRFGHCELHRAAHKLFRRHQEIPLAPKEYRLLQFLAEHAGRAVTRDQVLDAVWGEDLIVTSRSVDRCVTTLRQKIEPDPDHPTFIRTVRDVGYRFDRPDGP